MGGRRERSKPHNLKIINSRLLEKRFCVQKPQASQPSQFCKRESMYGEAKLSTHQDYVVGYRERHGLFICSGFLFNHESPRRGETFVTRKITRSVARIKAGIEKKLYLGNLDAKRDWGFAKEYVEAMWLMLQQEQPDDFVIATGRTHSIREFLEVAFAYVDLNWEEFVEIDPKYFRPTEVDLLCGDATKAKKILGWEPKTSFEDLIKLMVDSDIKELQACNQFVN